MSRFKTLLLREWMQHHRGWLAVMLVPPLLILAVLVFSDSRHIEPNDPARMMMACIAAVTLIVFAVTCMVVFLQAPGIARRDQQDRSIEFWVSLPTPHSASIGATVLMHALLVPLLGLGIGYACSQIVGVLAVTITHGVSGLVAVPWSNVLIGSLATVLRLGFGMVLAGLWLLPILLLAMAASAWLKRWGVPVLVAALVAGHLVLSKVYDVWVIGETAYALWSNALCALIHRLSGDFGKNVEMTLGSQWPVTPQWLVNDALASIRDLGQPLFVFAVAMSAACFALLVLRRQRA